MVNSGVNSLRTEQRKLFCNTINKDIQFKHESTVQTRGLPTLLIIIIPLCNSRRVLHLKSWSKICYKLHTTISLHSPHTPVAIFGTWPPLFLVLSPWGSCITVLYTRARYCWHIHVNADRLIWSRGYLV